MGQMIVNALVETAASFVAALRTFVPRALATFIVLLAGWLIAAFLRFATRRLLRIVRFNEFAHRLGASEVFRKAEMGTPDTVAGTLVFWIVFAGFILSGLDVLGFKGVGDLMVDFVHFIPRLLVALAILLTGFIAANFAWRASLLAAVNAGMPSARLAAGIVRLLIVVLAVAMALEQIAVAKTVVLTAFAIAFGAFMLAVAIAFGVGGGPVARRILEQQFPEKRADEGDGPSHL